MTYHYYVLVDHANIYVEVSEREYEKFQDFLIEKKRDHLSWKTIHIPDDPNFDSCQMFFDGYLIGFVNIPSYDID